MEFPDLDRNPLWAEVFRSYCLGKLFFMIARCSALLSFDVRVQSYDYFSLRMYFFKIAESFSLIVIVPVRPQTRVVAITRVKCRGRRQGANHSEQYGDDQRRHGHQRHTERRAAGRTRCRRPGQVPHSGGLRATDQCSQ